VCETEEVWIQDGRTEEPQEDAGADQLITDFSFEVAAVAVNTNGCKHLPQFSARQTNHHTGAMKSQKTCLRPTLQSSGII